MSSPSKSKPKVAPVQEAAWSVGSEGADLDVRVSEQDVPDYYLTGIIPHKSSQENSEDPNFYPVSSRSGQPRIPKYDDELRKRRQDASEFRYEVDPNYRGIIDAFLFFIIGNGFQIRANDEDEAVQEYIDKFIKASQFDGRDQDIILKGLRAGECFIRMFKSAGKLDAKVPVIRVYNYWEIKRIVRDEIDPEKILAYVRSYAKSDGTEAEEMIPPEEIFHVKVAEKDVRRATPPFDVVAQACQYYRTWLHHRVVFNRLKTSYYLEEIVKSGTPSQVSALDAATPNQDFRAQRGGIIKRMPKAGSKLTHNDAVEYKWLKPDVQADDAKEDGRAIRLSILAGAQAPEFILGDASNANYASAMVAQNPFVRKIEFFRDHYGCSFEEIFSAVIAHGIKLGVLKGKSTKTTMVERAGRVKLFRRWAARFNEVFRADRALTEKAVGYRSKEILDDQGNAIIQEVVDTDTSVKVEWPNLIAQNILQDSQAYQIHQAMGVASRQTIAQKLGYDYEEEERRIADENEADAQAQQDQQGFDNQDENGVQGFGGKKRDKEIDGQDPNADPNKDKGAAKK